MSGLRLAPHRRITCAAGLLMFLDSVLYLAVLPLLPRYEARYGLGTGGTGVLVASYVVATPFVSLLCIRLAARVGGKRVTLGSSVLTTVATVAFALAPNAEVLIRARFAQGVANGVVWAGAMAWVTQNAPVDRRGRESGIVMGLAGAGSVLGPGVGAIGAAVGTTPAFLGVAVLAALVVALTLSAPAGRPLSAEARVLESIRRALGSGRARAALGAALLNTFAFASVDVLVPLDLGHRGVSTGGIALAVGVGAALGAVLGPVAGRLVDRVGASRVAPCTVALVLLIPFALAVFAGVIPELVALLLGSPAFAFVGSSMYPLASAGADEAGASHAVASGLVGATWAGGFTLSALAAGWLGSAFGHRAALAIVGVACVMPFLVLVQGLSAASRIRRTTNAGTCG